MNPAEREKIRVEVITTGGGLRRDVLVPVELREKLGRCLDMSERVVLPLGDQFTGAMDLVRSGRRALTAATVTGSGGGLMKLSADDWALLSYVAGQTPDVLGRGRIAGILITDADTAFADSTAAEVASWADAPEISDADAPAAVPAA